MRSFGHGGICAARRVIIIGYGIDIVTAVVVVVVVG